LFVVIGVFNYIYCSRKLAAGAEDKKYSLILVIGLFFAMLGDILLIDFFEVGAILFAIGHIFYFIAFCSLSKINVLDIAIALLIFGLCLLFIWLYPYFDLQGMAVLIILYAFIISFMLGKGIGNFIKNKCLVRLVILLGASLFFFSDFMLLLFRFAHRVEVFDWFCVMTYYPAEFLLAFSLFMLVVKNIKSTANKLNK